MPRTARTPHPAAPPTKAGGYRHHTSVGILERFDSLPDSTCIDIRNLVALLNVSPATIWRFVKRGELKPVRFGRCTRWQVGEVRRFMAQGRGIVGDQLHLLDPVVAAKGSK